MQCMYPNPEDVIALLYLISTCADYELRFCHLTYIFPMPNIAVAQLYQVGTYIARARNDVASISCSCCRTYTVSSNSIRLLTFIFIPFRQTAVLCALSKYALINFMFLMILSAHLPNCFFFLLFITAHSIMMLKFHFTF